MKEIKKNSKRGLRAKSGFTLIELLVVIAIIGILAGLLLPAIAAARRYAVIVKARNDVKQIETAWRAYYTEYQHWPSQNFLTHIGQTDIETKGLKIAGDVADLLSKENIGGVYSPDDNPKKFVFISFRKLRGSDPVNPWATTNTTGTGITEGYYYVKVDQNYNNAIPAGTGGTQEGDPLKTPEREIRSSVIVWTVNPYEHDAEKQIIGSWK